MFSKSLAKKKVGAREGFNWRGKEITRIEGLSDCVFGFAVTLLVISLEVPKTYAELYVIMRGLPAFAVCFLQLMLVWHDQYTYFRRYGIEDTKTVMMTLALLFLVLYYTFPLKFLWTILMSPLADLIFGASGDAAKAFSSIDDLAHLMMLYHIGIMAVLMQGLITRRLIQRFNEQWLTIVGLGGMALVDVEEFTGAEGREAEIVERVVLGEERLAAGGFGWCGCAAESEAEGAFDQRLRALAGVVGDAFGEGAGEVG